MPDEYEAKLERFLRSDFLGDKNIPDNIKSVAFERALSELGGRNGTIDPEPSSSSSSWLSRLPNALLVALGGVLGSAVTIFGDYLLSQQSSDLELLADRNQFQLQMIERYLNVNNDVERARSLWFLHDVGILTMSEEALNRWAIEIVKANEEQGEPMAPPIPPANSTASAERYSANKTVLRQWLENIPAETTEREVKDALEAYSLAGHLPINYVQTADALAEIYADIKTPGNVLLFYSGRSLDADLWVAKDPLDGWNREHLWPQSRGARGFPMKTDLHALRPTDASINKRRGGLNFDNGGEPEGKAASTFLDSDSFEPRDEIKGDVARALFYMDIRYEGIDGDANLELVVGPTTTGENTMGFLCALLAWHKADAVDPEEVKRNGLIEGFQGNRNPFVDYPDTADGVFGENC